VATWSREDQRGLDDILRTAVCDRPPATHAGLRAYRSSGSRTRSLTRTFRKSGVVARQRNPRWGLSNTIWSRDYHREIFERDGCFTC
jgi:putative hydrolase of the HAD superfamily